MGTRSFVRLGMDSTGTMVPAVYVVVNVNVPRIKYNPNALLRSTLTLTEFELSVPVTPRVSHAFTLSKLLLMLFKLLFSAGSGIY